MNQTNPSGEPTPSQPSTPDEVESNAFQIDDLPDEIRDQVKALIEEHGADNLGTLSIERDDHGKVVVRRLEPEEVSMGVKEHSHSVRSAAPLANFLITTQLAEMQRVEHEARRKMIRKRAEEMARRREREDRLRDFQEANYNTALQMIQDAGRAGKRLRWTQISARLNPVALQGVKVALKHHPKITFTKKGKRTFVEWKD